LTGISYAFVAPFKQQEPQETPRLIQDTRY